MTSELGDVDIEFGELQVDRRSVSVFQYSGWIPMLIKTRQPKALNFALPEVS